MLYSMMDRLLRSLGICSTRMSDLPHLDLGGNGWKMWDRLCTAVGFQKLNKYMGQQSAHAPVRRTLCNPSAVPRANSCFCREERFRHWSSILVAHFASSDQNIPVLTRAFKVAGQRTLDVFQLLRDFDGGPWSVFCGIPGQQGFRKLTFVDSVKVGSRIIVIFRI
jgi:hypothetical protein